MSVWLVIAVMLASLAVAEPARATPGLPGPPAAVSDTDRASSVPRDRARWTCTRAVCTRLPASSSWSAALGFALTTLAAAGISRRRFPATR